mgnify:CR=1 FL=1
MSSGPIPPDVQRFVHEKVDSAEALREVPEIGPEGEKKVTIGIAKDGSGVGAALIALVAGKVRRPSATRPWPFV